VKGTAQLNDPEVSVKYDVFRKMWEETLRDAGLLTSHDSADETLSLGDMSRKHVVRVGVFQGQPAEPFTGSMELSWKWDALQSARTQTTEDDLVTELFGRDVDGDVHLTRLHAPQLLDRDADLGGGRLLG